MVARLALVLLILSALVGVIGSGSAGAVAVAICHPVGADLMVCAIQTPHQYTAVLVYQNGAQTGFTLTCVGGPHYDAKVWLQGSPALGTNTQGVIGICPV